MALTIAAIAPIGAQAPDVPELGFHINPTEGTVGTIVDGVVNTDDVAEHCVLDPEELLANFGATANAIFDHSEVGDFFYEDGYPPDPFDPDPIFAENIEQVSFLLTGLVPEQIGLDQAAEALPQTFVMAFADLATVSPIEPFSNFDPAVGFAQVTVPELAPGLHPVIATCVTPTTDPGALIAAIQGNVPAVQAFLDRFEDFFSEELPDFPWGINEIFGIAFGLSSMVSAGDPIGEELAVSVMEPQALGFDLFCVDCEPPLSLDDLAVFCGVLPEVQVLPERLAELFGGVDLEDPDTYPSVEVLEAFITEVSALLEAGDTSVPPTVAPQWSIATAELRELVFGLTAVGFDFATLVSLSPEDAQRIVDVGTGEGEPNPEFDAAVEVLTEFFLANCLVDDPEVFEVPDGVPGPAVPIGVTPRFTG